MKKIVYIALITVMALATSCVSQHNVNRAYSPLKPDYVRLDVTMADYEYLGDVTMEVVYKHYGLWRKVLTINGENYDPRYYSKTQLDFTKRVKMSSLMKKACYKVVETYPQANYIVPATAKKEYEHMFAGRNIKETFTVKVFALRTKSTAVQNEEMAQLKSQMEAACSKVQNENEQLKAQLQKTQEELDLQKRINEANQRGSRRK